MKFIIFAGGTGTRLWPISRTKFPKQFGKLKDNKSTLRMAIERIAEFGLDNIFISTNQAYVNLVKEELPELNPDNILGEPARRDLAAAVGLSLLRLKNRGVSGPVAILWADHFMDRPEEFRQALKKAESMVLENQNQIIFLGEKPRFANHNLGWIQVGKNKKDSLHEFVSWRYRPKLDVCNLMLSSGEWLWNPGYFVFDVDFILGLYDRCQPAMISALRQMVGNDTTLVDEYKNLEAISFDNAILEKINPEDAVVIKVDLGWSDPGTLYALKEALVKNPEEHLEKGNVVAHSSRDCMIYNEEDKLVAAVGLEGMMIVNTKDVLLVCHKDKVPEIKELLKKLEEDGKDKYL